jgi:hypothetical protein
VSEPKYRSPFEGAVIPRDVEKRAVAFAREWGCHQPSVSTMMAAFAHTESRSPTSKGVTEDQVEAALAAMNGGLIDARRPFHECDRSLMRAALLAAVEAKS